MSLFNFSISKIIIVIVTEFTYIKRNEVLHEGRNLGLYIPSLRPGHNSGGKNVYSRHNGSFDHPLGSELSTREKRCVFSDICRSIIHLYLLYVWQFFPLVTVFQNSQTLVPCTIRMCTNTSSGWWVQLFSHWVSGK